MPSFRNAALHYCRWLTEGSGSHFATAIRLLPYPKRHAMEVVYAFCRAVDDVVDLNGGDRSELARWRQELSCCSKGFPTHPIAVALQPVVASYQIPMEYFEALIQGVEMDLIPRRYRTFEELKVYCEHVASVVGLISIRIFGCQHPASESYARNLGVALQLTNILRDLKGDASRGRIYLPLKEMQRFGYSEADLLASRYTEAFQRLMAFQGERAWDFFRRAAEDLRKGQEARKLYYAQIMGGVYARLLKRIQRLRYDVFSHRVTVPRGEQILVAAQCLLSL